MKPASYAILAGLGFLGIANAQPAAPPLTFEAASVKPSPPVEPGAGIRVGMRGGPGTNDPGRIAVENFDLRNLISVAYGLNSYQLSAPNLPDAGRFNISATIPEGTTKEQFRLMFQNLLAERFKLAVHHEMKEIQVFELVVAKGGPKMTPSPKDPVRADTAPSPSGPQRPTIGSDGYPVLGQGGNATAMMNGRARMRLLNESMDKLAGMLSNQFGRPVENKTGIEGEYDVNLYWNTEGSGTRDAATTELDAGPTLMQAIQDQLGLKVQQTKGQVEMLVVDHIEKTPTEN